MSVIIRLQNLPWSANALDIRQYFSGLSIPEGGVHIVGGELGDAFIAFSTDEDARQAFQRNNGKIKSVQISLTLSSRTEMQRVIEVARNQTYSAFMQTAPQVPMPAAIPPVRPAPVPEIINLESPKETKNDKRDRKRSRSRDRRDRSRDRRRNRDRSRSRSRDRRRRRDRSRSNDRSRSRDRRSRDSSRRRSDDRSNSSKDVIIEPWVKNEANVVAPNLLSIANIVELRRNLAMTTALNGNGFHTAVLNTGRESWPQTNLGNTLKGLTKDDNFLNDSNSRDRRIFSKNMESNQIDPRISPNCCVKIEPFYGAYGDLRRFFHGCFISNRGIKFINDQSGIRTGIVYVQFGNPESKVEALARNNENLNGVNLSITHIDDREFENAVDRFIPKYDDDDNRHRFSQNKSKNNFNKSDQIELKNFSCLTVEDLPTYVKEQDILKMFSHYPLTGIILPPRGRSGHIAYVRFSNSDDAKKAVSEKSLHIVEGKSVTVKACKDEDFEKINKEHEVNMMPSPAQTKKKFETNCLKITGLPKKTNDRDISDFFSDVGVIPVKIHLINNEFGNFTGQAYCEFETEDETEKAVTKNSCILGTHLITVTPIKREEMESDISKNDNNQNEIIEIPDVSLNDNDNTNSNQNFFQNSGPRPLFHPSMRIPFDNNMRGRSGFMGRGGGRGNRFGPSNGPPSGAMRMAQQDDMTPPGCTVYMNNIPYKAGTNDILDFFDGYNVTNRVCRKFNANNTPTAEAKVVFHTAEDAYIAVRDKHLHTIWDRPIYLRQV